MGVVDPDRRDMGVRSMRQQARACHHEEIDSQRLPRDVAEIGDFQVEVAAKHVDPDDVADADMPALGEVGVEGDLRWAIVVGRPPRAGDQACPLGSRRRIGQAPVSPQRPGGFRRCRRRFRPAHP